MRGGTRSNPSDVRRNRWTEHNRSVAHDARPSYVTARHRETVVPPWCFVRRVSPDMRVRTCVHRADGRADDAARVRVLYLRRAPAGASKRPFSGLNWLFTVSGRARVTRFGGGANNGDNGLETRARGGKSRPRGCASTPAPSRFSSSTSFKGSRVELRCFVKYVYLL